MSDFAAYWDNIIKDWAETGKVPASEAFWFEDQKHLGLHRNLMPEPYWGDIDSNSVVMLNFNPAGAAAEHPADGCHRANRADPSTVCGLMSGCYSAVARSFPLLGGFPIEYEGARWWQRRVGWIDQFGIVSDRKPFALELCAWHSKKWAGGRYCSRHPMLRDYIAGYFGPWLRRALKGSEYHLALCVGSEFASQVFPLIWPDIEDITVGLIGSYQPEPYNARRFVVLRVPGEGHIVCTSARGGNGLPSENVFGGIEKKIIEKINLHKNI